MAEQLGRGVSGATRPPITAAPTGPNPGLNVPTLTPGQSASLETTAGFNGEQAELVWRDSRWQLVAGNVFLKDFGRYETEGREVLRVVRDLHLNSRTTLGCRSRSWNTGCATARRRTATLPSCTRCPSIRRPCAEQVQGQWCVHDGNRILFNFGAQGEACRQALTVIQRYGFTHIGYVGQVAPVMLVFLSNPPDIQVKPVNAQSHNGFSDIHFPNFLGNKDAAPNAPNGQPNQMPQVPSQPLNPQPGMPLHQPGSLTPAGFRLPGTEAADRVSIDARSLQVRRDGNDWRLTMGNHIVASFGPDQTDAQLAKPPCVIMA